MASSSTNATSASGIGQRNIDALISGYKWASTTITYAIPTAANQYASPVYVPATDETGSFQPVTGALASAVAAVMAQFSAVSGLSISQTASTSTATLLVGRSGMVPTAAGYLPSNGPSKGGDIWFGLDPDLNAPVNGNWAWATTLHEIGHAMGLKHAHSYIGGTGAYEDDIGIINQPVSSDKDSLEFTVMSYRSYTNQDLNLYEFYTNEDYGFPQTLMMLDIAALQQMYGADFSTNSGNSIYTFSATTGQMFIDGVGQAAPGANRIFRTIWDGGGTDTYSFSNYTTNMTIDLTPGGYSLLSSVQRASLGNGNFASGNVYNALQYQGNLSSLIENVIGGSGNDTITGNVASNDLQGGSGNDSVSGGDGADWLWGMDGDDSLFGGTGDDALTGGIGNDMLVGDAGDDFLFGGSFVSGGFGAGSGNDTFNGGDGRDAIYGFDGDDYIVTGSGNDYVEGNEGSDAIIGGAGNSFLQGGTGSDAITGGGGFDYLYGNAGADLFIFRVGDSYDWILDFSAAEGDRFRLDPGFGITSFAEFQAAIVDGSSPGSPATILTRTTNGTIFDEIRIFGIAPGSWNAAMIEFI